MDSLGNYLSQHNIPYYFCGGFACPIGHSPQLATEIDVVVESGTGYYTFLNSYHNPHFTFDETGTLSERPFFYVEQTSELVAIDSLLAGWGGNFPCLGEVTTIEHNGFQFLDLATLLHMKLKAWDS